MAQPMPVVRQVYWPGMLPQLAAIGVLAAVAWLCYPRAIAGSDVLAQGWTCFFTGAMVYWLICGVMRWIFAGDYKRGVRAYKRMRFADALGHFQASRDYFSTHPRLDSWRSLLLGVASYHPYRVMALASIACCYGQLGDGAKAIALYEEVLREAPDHAGARASLNMLRAGAAKA